jgi:type I restriction enzyme S subunit
MTLEQLKSSILQYAIQGKLVEQREEEGTGEELYQKIREEKQKLITEGKIKKEKPLPEIKEEEKPFDIPESWEWVRLNDVVYNHGQKTPNTIFSYIDIGSIDNVHQKLNAEETLIESAKAPSRARKIVKEGDIIYSTVRPYLHNTCIIDKSFKAEPIASTGFAVLACHSGLYNKYLFYYLLAPAFDNYANATDNAKGVAYPAINDDKLYRALVALPPLTEQHRIVAKIEELLPYVDRYAQSWKKLEHFNAKFPEDMKKSILQYAIQGKLVEQIAEEGTAEELYQQIQAEKQKLITEGKIKKEKPLPEIKEDEIPFDIPENWKWCRIGQIFNLQAGKNITSSNIYEVTSDEHPYLCYGGNGIRGFTEAYNREGHYPLIGRQGALCGNINLANGKFYATEHAVVVDHFDLCNVLWCVYFLRALNLNQYATATAQPGLAVANIVKVLIPLPPLAEQHRIVAKIEELLPYCDRLVEK